MSSAYRIHTRRLVLRCWSPADTLLLQAAIETSLEHLRPWMPWATEEPETMRRRARRRLERFRAWFEQGKDLVYGIFDPDERQVLGGCGLHRRIGAGAGEIGYWIHVDHTGRGLATEAAAALTRVGFQAGGLARIEIHCDPANAPSAAIPRKLGFALQVTVPKWVNAPKPPPRDTMFWVLSAERFPASPAAAAGIEAFDAAGERVL
ncbi:MAG: GNAT family N-acetyltransferase [Planctomycetota bacterium]